MIRYLFLPMLMLLLVIVQITILELFSFGWIAIEISLIGVVFLGFHVGGPAGGLLSLLLGFFMDCLNSAIFGLYMFLYVLIFFLSHLAGRKIYSGNPVLISFFTGICAFFEGLVIALFYHFVFGADILDAIPKIFIPQAVVAGVLSPFCFILFQRLEAFLYAEDQRPARHL